MHPRAALITGLVACMSSVAIAVAALAQSARYLSWDPFYLWISAPYAVFAVALILPWGSPVRRIRSGCFTSIVLLVDTYLTYRTFWFSPSSTAPLIFLFLPLYLVPEGLILWLLASLFGERVWARLTAETSTLD